MYLLSSMDEKNRNLWKQSELVPYIPVLHYLNSTQSLLAMFHVSTFETGKILILVIFLLKPENASTTYKDTSTSVMKRSRFNPITKVFMFNRNSRSQEKVFPLQLKNTNWEGQDLSWLSAEALVSENRE